MFVIHLIKNMLLNILIVLAIIIALLLIIAMFTKKEYSIMREVIINKVRHEVFDYIKLQKNQEQYSKWVMADPAMKKEYRGIDGTVGFVYGWNGNKKAGEGEQEIKSVKEGERVDCEIRFVRPFASVSQTAMTTETLQDGKTKVTWIFNGKNKYPLNLMFVFISVDKLLGADMEESLSNLKRILETNNHNYIQR